MEHTATILFSDIKGSSVLSEQQALIFKRQVEPTILNKLAETLRSDTSANLLDDARGPILYYNTWGDAYLFVLRSPNHALQAALVLRDGFRDFNFSKLGLPGDITIRCSIHAGVVNIDEFDDPIRGGRSRDVIGKNVVISARIEPITPPGRIWVTEEFKTLLQHTPSKIALDSLGVKQLSKQWGASNLYEVRREGEQIYQDDSTLLQENIREQYLPITLRKDDGIYTIEISGKPILCQQSMKVDLWGQKIQEMSELFCVHNKNGAVSDIGVAVGIQNFIFDGNRLCAGVRTKAMDDEWGTGFTLGIGSFNTGYRRIKSKEDFDDHVLNEIQDLFRLVEGGKSPAKQYVREGDDVDNIIKKKGGHNRCIIKINGEFFVALIFINTSRIFPRFEIGICKYIKIGKLNFDDLITSFGSDAYVGMPKEEGNYWLWVNDGMIYARSIANEKHIPCIKERKKVYGQKAILIRNDIKKYGFIERYVPSVSDEVLSNAKEVLTYPPFTSPARSLLELF